MYLPSFYKLKFEKYISNCRTFAGFAVPAGLWCSSFPTQASGSYTTPSTTASTPTSSLPNAESSAESLKKSEQLDSNQIYPTSIMFIHKNSFEPSTSDPPLRIFVPL